MSRETELAWAAGFFDGEGSTWCSKTLGLTVSQVERSPLERFLLAMEGRGKITGPYKNNPILRYAVYGPNAQRCLMLLWPFLSEPKRRQGMTALVRYWCRPVRDPQRCRRGHLYAEVGTYQSPTRGRECEACRRARRAGPLPAPRWPTAYERRIGHRVYTPSPVGAQR